MSKNHQKIYTKLQNIGECSKWRDLGLLEVETWMRYRHKGHVERSENNLQVKSRLNKWWGQGNFVHQTFCFSDDVYSLWMRPRRYDLDATWSWGQKGI